MNYKEQIEKIAANKITKMIKGGNVPPRLLDQLYERAPIINNLNNRINAKAKRVAEGIAGKGNVTARKYKNISKVDNLPSRAVMDTGRMMKHQGRENGKVINELKKRTYGDVNIEYIDDAFKSKSKAYLVSGYDEPLSFDIKIPEKKTEFPNLTPRESKEFRSTIARHEIAGESKAQTKIINAFGKNNVPINYDTIKSFRVGTHAAPDVLTDDAKYVNKLSPTTKTVVDRLRSLTPTKAKNHSYNNGLPLSESELINVLRSQKSSELVNGNEALINQHSNPIKAKKFVSNSFINHPKPNKDEVKNMVLNSAYHNNKADFRYTHDKLNDVVNNYTNDSFFTK